MPNPRNRRHAGTRVGIQAGALATPSLRDGGAARCCLVTPTAKSSFCFSCVFLWREIHHKKKWLSTFLSNIYPYLGARKKRDVICRQHIVR